MQSTVHRASTENSADPNDEEISKAEKNSFRFRNYAFKPANAIGGGVEVVEENGEKKKFYNLAVYVDLFGEAYFIRLDREDPEAINLLKSMRDFLEENGNNYAGYL